MLIPGPCENILMLYSQRYDTKIVHAIEMKTNKYINLK